MKNALSLENGGVDTAENGPKVELWNNKLRVLLILSPGLLPGRFDEKEREEKSRSNDVMYRKLENKFKTICMSQLSNTSECLSTLS